MAGRARGSSQVRGSSADDTPLVVGGVVALVALLVGMSFVVDSFNLDVWSAVIVEATLLAITAPVVVVLAKRAGWNRLVPILLFALVLKFAVSLVRYYVIFKVYKGEGDAGIYVEAAAELAKRIRLGLPLHPLDYRIKGYPVQTQYMGDLTGFCFYLTANSKYATFFIFSWFCFIGQVLFAYALKIAIPEARFKRYLLLVLFLPSLLFWPSSAGKEAVMVFSLGLIFFGAALLLKSPANLLGLVPFGGGAVISYMIRPHITVMAAAALAAAFTVGALAGKGAGVQQSLVSRTLRILGLLLMVVVFLGAFSRAGEALGGGEQANGEERSTEEILQRTAENSATGNSAFTPPQVTSPVDVPWAVVTVLFRPFPFEASGGSLIAAAESLLLVVLFTVSAGRLLTWWPLFRRRPYLVFVTTFVIEFAIGFSYIGNFGILARQRVMMLPAVLVLLALPTRKELAAFDAEAAGEQAELPAADRSRRTLGSLSPVGAGPQS